MSSVISTSGLTSLLVLRICAVTYITEISLHMTLNNKSHKDKITGEKGKDLTQSYFISPDTHKNPKSNVTTQNVTKNFDYTTIADRLRTVSWSNNSHHTGVIKRNNLECLCYFILFLLWLLSCNNTKHLLYTGSFTSGTESRHSYMYLLFEIISELRYKIVKETPIQTNPGSLFGESLFNYFLTF